MTVTQRQAQGMAVAGLALASTLMVATGGFVAAGWGRCSEAWQATSQAGGRACEIMLNRSDIGGAGEGLGFGFMGVLFAALGAVLASRRKDNALGWIFLATGLVFVGNAFTTVYTIHATEAPGSLPAAVFVAVVAEVLGGPVVFAPFALFFLLFPNGHVLSRRWRLVVGLVVASVVVQTLDLALHPAPLRLSPLQTNPFGLPWLTDDIRPWIQMPAFALLLIALIASVISMVLRFRRSRGVERQQMKWFTTSSAFVGLTFVFAPLFWATPALEFLWGPLFILATASVPVAATLAILRYRLYDLDVFVNRALVYGGLTGLLGALYLGSVFVMQAVLSGVGGSSDIAVAGSTLVVAALFRPLRSRLQSFIDHRFYRRKYNARRTLEAFSSQLRHETDLATLRAEMLAAVDSTIQPARATVWLANERRA